MKCLCMTLMLMVADAKQTSRVAATLQVASGKCTIQPQMNFQTLGLACWDVQSLCKANPALRLWGLVDHDKLQRIQRLSEGTTQTDKEANCSASAACSCTAISLLVCSSNLRREPLHALQLYQDLICCQWWTIPRNHSPRLASCRDWTPQQISRAKKDLPNVLLQAHSPTAGI